MDFRPHKSIWSCTLAVQADVTHRACVPVVAGSRIERVGASALRVASIVGTHVAVVAVGLNRARSTVSAVADVSKRAGISVFTRKLVIGCGASCRWIAPSCVHGLLSSQESDAPVWLAPPEQLIGRACVSVIAFGVVGSEYAIAIHAASSVHGFPSSQDTVALLTHCPACNITVVGSPSLQDPSVLLWSQPPPGRQISRCMDCHRRGQATEPNTGTFDAGVARRARVFIVVTTSLVRRRIRVLGRIHHWCMDFIITHQRRLSTGACTL